MKTLAIGATALLLTVSAPGIAGAETINKPLTPTPEEAYRQAIVAYAYGVEPAYRVAPQAAPGYWGSGVVAGDPVTGGVAIRR